jgi:hypothetical protein
MRYGDIDGDKPCSAHFKCSYHPTALQPSAHSPLNRQRPGRHANCSAQSNGPVPATTTSSDTGFCPPEEHLLLVQACHKATETA